MPATSAGVARLALADRAEIRVELGHLTQAAICQTEPHSRNAGGDRLGHHLLVGCARQRPGNKGDLLERGHPQAVLLGGGETQPLEQVIHQTATAVYQHQRTVLIVEKGFEGGEQGGQRLVVLDKGAAQLDYQRLFVHVRDPS